MIVKIDLTNDNSYEIYIEKLKAAEKTEHFSEDETKRGEAEIQKITDKYITEIDAVLTKKEKEIMED